MATTPNVKRDDSLLQGGPGDQAGPSADPRDTGRAGSQQGRPQQQEDAAAPARVEGGRAPRAAESRNPVPDAQDDRAVSETERQAGNPDDRATTDWTHGEGEPAGREPPAGT